MRVLVTGADGFIGSHLVELLLEKEYNVLALAQYNSFNNWGWLESIPSNSNLEIVTGDIRDPYFVKSILSDISIVFHLASLIAIPYSYMAPYSYLETNIQGTLNICQAAREKKGIRVLCTSTSEVYGNAHYVPIDEKHPKQPQSPYSATKIAADAIALSFFYTYGLSVTIVRPFNTYGPRQSARAIIPTIITQIACGEKQIKLGDLTPRRDFNYVKDVCNGFLAISQCNKTIGMEINIASNSSVSIGEIFSLITRLMNKDANYIFDEVRQRPLNSEVNLLMGDNKLITSLTNWEPLYSLENGLKETISWFLHTDNLNKYKPGIYNM